MLITFLINGIRRRASIGRIIGHNPMSENTTAYQRMETSMTAAKGNSNIATTNAQVLFFSIN